MYKDVATQSLYTSKGSKWRSVRHHQARQKMQKTVLNVGEVQHGIIDPVRKRTIKCDGTTRTQWKLPECRQKPLNTV